VESPLPGLLQLLLGEERADVHRLPELHVGQFTGHGDGRVPAAQRMEARFNHLGFKMLKKQTAENTESAPTDL